MYNFQVAEVPDLRRKFSHYGRDLVVLLYGMEKFDRDLIRSAAGIEYSDMTLTVV